MSYDSDNIFAKILRGDLPCIKVYEDEHTLAFMDIMPQADGHTLVIPKEPAVDLMELSADAASNLIIQVQKVARAVKQAMQADGITIFQLNGAAAGQTVPHIHFHILPGAISHAKAHASIRSDSTQIETYAKQIRQQL